MYMHITGDDFVIFMKDCICADFMRFMEKITSKKSQQPKVKTGRFNNIILKFLKTSKDEAMYISKIFKVTPSECTFTVEYEKKF
jgi:hypothetical protein